MTSREVSDITPRTLLQLGFHEFSWNNGVIMEYWLPLFPEKPNFDYRLGIRFGEHKWEPVNVWLITQSMLKLTHIDSIEKVKQMYKLLTGVRI